MARRARRRRPTNPATTYESLGRRLVLLDWLHRRLGYPETRALLEDVAKADEGYDPDGRSYACARISSRVSNLNDLTPDDLARYDDNIRNRLAEMNDGRPLPITLRYFQYLAALYSEIFLDWYFNRRKRLLESLNKLVVSRNSRRGYGEAREKPFEESDLRKLAFWMATGSGKTLIMHLNYRQFLEYNDEPLDNILLVTPNERLTEQHLDELSQSGIPAARLDPERGGPFLDPNTVQVTEITKLSADARGQGASVPVDMLEGNNLVFVDEGHKGSGGDAWRDRRAEIARTGFTFEYSATFGQAITAAREPDLVDEYGKAIAFDYSYSHFYNDGYGKDFRVLNLQRGDDADVDTLLLGNMLSFYEQRRLFDERRNALHPYNIERPLWVFVGATVNNKDKEGRTDILTVAKFLHRVLSDRAWATQTIGDLLSANSGLRDDAGRDVFQGSFDFLKKSENSDPASVYRDMIAKTLHAPSGGGLQISAIRNHAGELGLKASGADEYFGLIYIGDTAEFRTLATNEDSGITVNDDAISDSLFSEISQPGSRIDVLIGAQKFMEGWNSWRVSNMGLLNIGRSEGSQIIQLFGRGVRLRGRDMSLKRSSALGHRAPENIRLLETLNIFAVKANYMAKFRDYLEREGVPVNDPVQMPLFIEPAGDLLDKGLVIPRIEEGSDFNADAETLFAPEDGARPVSVDLSARLGITESGDSGVGESQAASGGKTLIPAANLNLLDWDKLYLDLTERLQQKGFTNLLVKPAALRPILEMGDKTYTLIADDSITNPRTVADLERLQQAALSILRKYAENQYRRHRERWESDRMTYKPLDGSDPNFTFNASVRDPRANYLITLPSADSDKNNLAKLIEELNADFDRLRQDEYIDLPRIHFDRHLYQPLLLASNSKIRISPPGLNESERQFVSHLKDYWRENHDGAMRDSEIFLLRNQSRGTGVGFFQTGGFYPDFILWIKTGDDQRLIFIEPHGMMRANAYAHDDKAQLHERLPELARSIAKRSSARNVSLDSYIVSATAYQDLYRGYDDGSWTRADFAAKHILFPERDDDYDYIAELLG